LYYHNNITPAHVEQFNVVEVICYEVVISLLCAGFLGLCTLLLLWPGLVILHVTKIEELVWPNSLEWAVLFISGIVGVVISNLLWLWSVLLSSVSCTLCW